MKIKALLLPCATGLALLGMGPAKTSAAVPPDYPYVVVTNGNRAAPGNLIGTVGGGGPDGSRTYYVILDNTGTNLVFASTTNVLLRFVTPQGFATATDASGWRFKDERLEIVDTFTTLGQGLEDQGYGLDTHDVKFLPNGHALVLGLESRSGATGCIIQEIDSGKGVVFEWHSFDHIAIADSFGPANDYTHANAVTIDPTDNNLLASFRDTSEIVKINRSTGQLMWRLGGKMNQFTFIAEHTQNAPYYTLGQHDVHRLANGNLLYFDNGNIGGDYVNTPRNYSRAVEYALDEVNKIATLVWEYRHVPDIQANCEGSVKRMANGNTFIDWGCASGLIAGTIVTEVNPAGQVVFEMTRRETNGASPVGLRSGLTKQLWNSPDLVRSAAYQDIQAGQTYDSPQAGVSVTVNDLTGASNNTLTVQRYLDAVRFPSFSGKAPQVVMEHLVLSGSNILTWEAGLNLNIPDTSFVFDTPMIHDPAQVVVYWRATPGHGEFSPLPTNFDPSTKKLQVTTTQFGELIFGYPDVAVAPSAPTIRGPADQSEVNQYQPVTLAWSAPGLVDSFDLQLSTDAGFGHLAINTNVPGATSYQLTNPAPDTQYFWRVRSVNQGGTSVWASASFATAPPTIQVTVPVGGEIWQRFTTVTLRWTANISGTMAIDLYKDGVSNQTVIASAPGSGAYSWTIMGLFQPISPGSNYTIRVSSATDRTLFSVSAPFTIFTYPTSVTLDTEPPGLDVSVDGTNYTAPAQFNWLPSSSHTLDTTSPQVAADGETPFVFASWSDGGPQSHSITVPFSPLSLAATFTAISTNALRCTIVSVTIAGETFSTTWAGIPGFEYTIEHASTMDGPWVKYENKIAGPDGLFSITPFVSQGTAFFRTRYPAY